ARGRESIGGMNSARQAFSTFGLRPPLPFSRAALSILIALLLAIPALAQRPDAGAGKKIYEAQCSNCHGLSGAGGRGPALPRPKLTRAADDDELRKLISNGYGDMPGAWQLHSDEVASVAAYVRTLGAIPPEIVPGDPDRGATLYASRGCAGCHAIAGK